MSNSLQSGGFIAEDFILRKISWRADEQPL